MQKRQINIQYFETPFGELILGDFENRLCLCDWRYRKTRNVIDLRIKTGLTADYAEQNTPLITTTIEQLEEYFSKKRTTFEIPILLIGTEFQKEVWTELMQIPYSKTISYSELSKRINNPKAVRAVASANGANAISIIIPCHRVIGKNNQLTGYAGGIAAKEQLLKLENKYQ